MFSLFRKRLNFNSLRFFSNRSRDASLIIPGTIKLKPKTPGTRHARLPDKSNLFDGPPIEELTTPLKRTGGRNNHGRITVRGRGGGEKRVYRFIDFKRNIYDTDAKVVRLEFDPNRSSHIALLKYPDGKVNYILAPENVKPGDVIISSRQNDIELLPGNAMPIHKIPVGYQVHNVEIRPTKGAQLARSAGCSLKVFAKNTGPKNNYVTVEMASKEKRLINNDCLATIGRVGNINHNKIILGKAGLNRARGRRPKVRGVAMNPCDHPNGGGNGKSKGKPSRSKWGAPLGKRTRKKKHRTDIFRVERRPMNKRRYKKK